MLLKYALKVATIFSFQFSMLCQISPTFAKANFDIIEAHRIEVVDKLSGQNITNKKARVDLE